MEKLLYGSEALAPEFFDSYDDQLYLVPFKVVKEAAEVFPSTLTATFLQVLLELV